MTSENSNVQDEISLKHPDTEELQIEGQKDGELSIVLELEPRRTQNKSIFLVVIICLAIVCHWFVTSELFDIPKEVLETRSGFIKAKEAYILNPPYWDAKLRYFKDVMHRELIYGEEGFHELMQEAPRELFVAFLLRELHLSLERLEETTAFPRNGSTFSVVVSKPEGSVWPLKIILSIEIEVKYSAEKFSLAISRLRRGSQDIALNLAWAYFGPELETLRAFEANTHQVILVTTKD